MARPWEEIQLDHHRSQILDRLEEMDGYCLPASDLEAQWLAEVSHPRLLNPPAEAFTRTAKPFDRVGDLLPVRFPESISLKAPARELYDFAIRHNWGLWAKGPLMDAYRVRNSASMQNAQSMLSGFWGNQPFFLQRHIGGNEVALAFAAHEGRLLGAIYTEKRQITNEGKCWAAVNRPPPPHLLAALKNLVEELNWSGGGELEFVHDHNDDFWLIDWNYRFPAWIHGATLMGTNLPARLIEAATGIKAEPTPARCDQFTRVVMEVPVRRSMPLPSLSPILSDGRVSSKFSAISTSGLNQFMARLSNRSEAFPREDKTNLQPEPEIMTGPVAEEISSVWSDSITTPATLFLPQKATDTFVRAQAAFTRPRILPVNPAYSVKTNPDKGLMRQAREHGFCAEVISVEEALWARKQGYALSETIYNGPVPLDPARLEGAQLRAVFADSLESFKRLCSFDPAPAKLIGLRLNPLASGSRFGVRLDTPRRFKEVVATIRDLLPEDVAFGIHFHLQSSTCGTGWWLKHARALLQLAHSLETATGRKIELLDIGGGWTSENLGTFLEGDLDNFLTLAHDRLPHVQQVFIEPGKAICEQAHVLATRVLEIRDHQNFREVVVDACLSDVPQAGFLPRDVYWQRPPGELQRLQVGSDRILGRVCMEHDILVGGLDIPPNLGPGSVLIFSHAGAYDISMSYTFGVGGDHV